MKNKCDHGNQWECDACEDIDQNYDSGDTMLDNNPNSRYAETLREMEGAR